MRFRFGEEFEEGNVKVTIVERPINKMTWRTEGQGIKQRPNRQIAQAAINRIRIKAVCGIRII